jgi:hypothetical protein
MNPRRIVIDGTSYNSVSEMPLDVRRQYEQAMRTVRSGDTNAEPNTTDNLTNLFADKNNDGIPDLIENIPAINVFGGTKFVVDGVEYNSVADLPPEARAKYEQAVSALDKNQNGVPDFLGRLCEHGEPAIDHCVHLRHANTASIPTRVCLPATQTDVIHPCHRPGYIQRLDDRARWRLSPHAVHRRRGWRMVFLFARVSL